MENKLNQNVKGMNLDSLTSQVGQGEVTWALNANIQSFDGSRYAYTNELGNQVCTYFKPGFVVVGQPYYIIEKDITIFALHNPTTGESEIGQVTGSSKDCLELISKEKDCGCEKGSVLEDEIVEKLETRSEIKCPEFFQLLKSPDDQYYCEKIEYKEPSVTSTEYTLQSASDTAWGFGQPSLYDPGWNFGGWGGDGSFGSGFTKLTQSWWRFTVIPPNQGRINTIAKQSTTPAIGTWLSFSTTICIEETKTYYFAIAADDYFRVTLDGNTILYPNNSPGDYTQWKINQYPSGDPNRDRISYMYLHIYPLQLTAGGHVLQLEYLNAGGPHMIAAEIYDNTAPDIIAATSIDDLNIIWTTQDQTQIQNITYTCAEGYTLAADPENDCAVACVKITQQDPTIVKFPSNCCKYDTVVSNPCLNFSEDHPVWFKHKTTACDTLLYFVSKNNPPRRVSLSTPKGVDACGKPIPELDCDTLDLFPKTCHPEILPTIIDSGGSLKAGSYRFTLAYTDINGNELTDYFDLTSEVPIFERPITFDIDYITNKSIQVHIKHHTDIFQYFNLAVQQTANTVSTYYLIGTYRVTSDANFTFTGNVKEEYSQARILNRTPRYEAAGIIEDNDNVLFLADLEGDIDYNIQPLANKIRLYWETVEMPADNKNFNYHNGIIVSDFRGYMRDEVYAFGIKFKLKNGKYTKIYHIPGREALSTDLAPVPSLINGSTNEDRFYKTTNCPPPAVNVPTWQVYNTAKVFNNKKGCLTFNDYKEKQFSCEITPYAQGDFAYWQSTLTYPCNEDIWDTDSWGNKLAGQPIRFHRFPECATGEGTPFSTHIHNNHSVGGNAKIYPIGVRPDMDLLTFLINNHKIYNPKTKQKDILLKDIICGFELVRSSRVGNKSVIAKGLTYDVGLVDDKENNRSYYFPNYPYNDVSDTVDPYLASTSDVYDSPDVGTKYNDIKQYSSLETKLRYTFHSPDTSFQFPQLGTEIKIESCEKGYWTGHFREVREHPRYKFLTKFDQVLSVLLGTALSFRETNETEDETKATAADGGSVSKTKSTLELDYSLILTNTELLRNIIEKLIPYYNYAWTFHSLGNYTEASFPQRGNKRRILDKALYLSPNNQTVGDNHAVWNYQRESSVYLKLAGDITNANSKRFRVIDPAWEERSRFTLSSWANFRPGDIWCDRPTEDRSEKLKSNYVSIKRTVEDQYGPLDNITYVNTGDFYEMTTQQNGQGFFYCKYYPTFGGDIFINRFSLKRKMPFFLQNMVGRPDGINFDYQLVPNVMYPTYYIGTSPDTLSLNEIFTTEVKVGLGIALSTYIIMMGIDILAPPNTISNKVKKAAQAVITTSLILSGTGLLVNILSGFIPKNNLDCDKTLFADRKYSITNFANFFASFFQQGDSDKNFTPFYQKGKFYLSSYGIPTFFVESEVNVDMRHGRNENEENFYPNVGDSYDDWLQEYRVQIKFDNYYSYNATYSKQNFENFNQPYNDFKPDEICQIYYPNRIIYSDPSTQEEEKDSWRVFRTNNYYDFPKTNGKLIAVNSVENEKVLARFENTTQAYNSRIVLDSSYPVQIELGTGNMFSQRPVEYVKADLGYVGSQHKAYVSCKYGSFWTDAKRGFIYQLSGSSGFDEITKTNFNWFKRNLPFRILEDFPDFPIDNSFKDIGIAMVWDERFERVFITKKDYKLTEYYSRGAGKGEVVYKDGKFYLVSGDDFTPINLDTTQFFENKSWTISYSPITKGWLSFYSFIPNYYVGLSDHFQSGIKVNVNGVTQSTLWNHVLSPLRYQTYYNKLEPYIVEYSVDTLPQVSTINSVTLFQDIQKFYNKTDFYSLGSSNATNKVNFNKAILYNKEQCSGMLYLIPENPNDMSQRTRFPRVQSDHIEILYSHREQKFTFNSFWDTVNWTSNNQPIFVTDWDILQNSYYIDKVLNPDAIVYQSRQGRQMPLRSTHCRIRLIQDVHSRFRFINTLQNTQTNNSII